jgi:hypothetical protein
MLDRFVELGADAVIRGRRAARWIGQQCCRKLHFTDQGSQSARPGEIIAIDGGMGIMDTGTLS